MMSPALSYAKLIIDSAIRDYAHKKPWEDNSSELADVLNLGRLMLNVAHSLAVAANDPEAPEYLALYQKCQDLARPWVKRVLPTDGFEERNTLKLILDVLYETQREVIALREALKVKRAKRRTAEILPIGKEAA